MERIVSKSLSFGNQNFFFCNSYVGSPVTGDDNEYVAYMDTKGLILIARFNAAGDEGRYCTKAGEYDEIVEARGEHEYLLPNEIKEIGSNSIR
jgi:hypothetical protein